MSDKGWVRFAAVTLGLFAVALLLFFSAGSLRSQGTSRGRFSEPIDSSRTRPLRGTRLPRTLSEFDAGGVEPERRLNHLSLNFRLQTAQQADLEELLREQRDPSSPNYQRWLTPEQYASRFGMSQSDLAKVAAWLTSQGLSVEGPSRNRNQMFFSGSVGAIEYALSTQIHYYSGKGEAHFANSTDVSMPEAFASEVLSVRGLDNFSPQPKFHRVPPRFTSNATGNHFLIPGDFATIYDLPSGLDGTGQSIAIIGQTQISTTDIDKFRSGAGLPARTSANFIQTLVPGTGSATACSGDETEADLDLEWSEGVAKNATINYVFAGLGTGTTCNNRTANVFDALEYAITSRLAPIISISYGNCEPAIGRAAALSLQQLAQQANAQGQTIVGPAGDSGAADCDSGNNSATQGLAVDVPAAIPEVTGVGGSEFTGDAATCPPITATGGGCSGSVAPPDSPYWGGASSSNSGPTALEYIPEETWNDTAESLALIPPGGLAGGGGGVSTIFPKPAWQTGAGVPSDGKRDVPDIALNASDFHDPYLFCSQDVYAGSNPEPTTCTNGFRDSGGGLAAVGGTSAGAPTFAGVLALINQATSSNGLGNVNPMLYSLAASTRAAFHDITSGDNKVPCTSGTTNCPSGTTAIGFSATPGYDRVTGLGSLDVSQLITAWKAALPPGNFSIDAQTASAAAGQSATSTVTLTALAGFAGTINLTCASTQVSCSLNPTSVTLSSANSTQSSTLTLTSAADLRLPNRRNRKPLWLELSGGVFAVAILGGMGSRRRWTAVFAVALVAIFLTAVGCGGVSSQPPPAQQTQTSQTFNVTVTGTETNSSGATLSHSATVAFTVD